MQTLAPRVGVGLGRAGLGLGCAISMHYVLAAAVTGKKYSKHQMKYSYGLSRIKYCAPGQL